MMTRLVVGVMLFGACFMGCAGHGPLSATPHQANHRPHSTRTELVGVPQLSPAVSHQPRLAAADAPAMEEATTPPQIPSIRLVVDVEGLSSEQLVAGVTEEIASPVPTDSESLAELESLAVRQNPNLRRLRQEAAAARERVRYIDRLPDPIIGANVFTNPIETAAGSQRANMALMQTLPSLKRLDAQAQQACFEAMALQQVYHMERLKLIGDVRAAWNRLYIIHKQLETTAANQELLEVLVERATAIISAGKGAASDVRLGVIEIAQLEERKLTLRQQLRSVSAELNRLVGRNADTPVEAPSKLDVSLPNWSLPVLNQTAMESQPAIGAAQIRTQATRWGVEVARLQRRPNVTWSASWFAIDDNRPASPIVSVGQDAWSVGAQVSIPLWHEKYDSMHREARWKHAASHATVDEVTQQYESTLRDLWEQAKAAYQTAELYRDTILPEARRTLDADSDSYGNTDVEFDRVMKDFRTVLTLQLGYDEAVGRLATALARIRQATGVELE